MEDLAKAVGELVFFGRINPNFIYLMEKASEEYPEMDKFIVNLIEDSASILQKVRKTESKTTMYSK